MKNKFLTRTATAILFVTVIFAALLLHHVIFGIVFFLFMSVALSETYNLLNGETVSAQNRYGLFVSSLIFIFSYLFSQDIVGINIFLLIVPLFMVFFIIEIFKKEEKNYSSLATTIFGIVYVTVPFSLFNFLETTELTTGEIDNFLLLAFFLILWANDTGAYITGSLIGKHKFIEHISPKKTMEGTMGGILSSAGVAAIISQFNSGLNIWVWIGFGVIVAVSGTYGDLAESMMKRRAGIKDSGKIMPGHGGILDRFDSFIFAVPVAYTYIKLIELCA